MNKFFDKNRELREWNTQLRDDNKESYKIYQEFKLKTHNDICKMLEKALTHMEICNKRLKECGFNTEKNIDKAIKEINNDLLNLL